MPGIADITGQRFGRLVAIEPVDKLRWRCICDCGRTTIVYKSNVARGLTKSCGCFRREASSINNTTHGHSRLMSGRSRKSPRSKTYAAWSSMMERCYNPRNKQFKDWGGRGINVWPLWHVFENFLTDMGECPSGLTIDRIDNDRNYDPDNCRWATRTEQNRHKRTTKLTMEKALLIRRDSRPVREIVKTFAVSRSLVYQIKAGTIWR